MEFGQCPECNTLIRDECDICINCWDNLPLGGREDLEVDYFDWMHESHSSTYGTFLDEFDSDEAAKWLEEANDE